MYFFWGASIVWFISVFNKMDFTRFTSPIAGIPSSVTSFATVVLMVWWCFAGFETVVGMGAEVKFPKITLPRALCISPFIVFGVNTLFQWFLVGLTPADSLSGLATATAPFAFCMAFLESLRQPLPLCLHAGMRLPAADDTAKMLCIEVFRGQVDKTRACIFHVYTSEYFGQSDFKRAYSAISCTLPFSTALARRIPSQRKPLFSKMRREAVL